MSNIDVNKSFNIFSFDDFVGIKNIKESNFRIRNYHKIMLLKGEGDFLYSNKIIPVKGFSLIFANPELQHKWQKRELLKSGYSCIFETDFLFKEKRINNHLFKKDENFVIHLDEKQYVAVEDIFKKINENINSEYIYKYDLLKILVYEIMHFALKLNNNLIEKKKLKNSDKIYQNFMDLLERQFPIDDPIQNIQLYTPSDYAHKLCIHVNHLNRTIKKITGKTTSELIKKRIIEEVKLLLLQTDWSISQIANCFNYSEVTHFSNFFKKHEGVTPTKFRNV